MSDAGQARREVALRANTLGPRLFHVALRVLHSEADAEDVVQQTFTDAIRASDDFRGEASVDTWIWRIGHRQIGKALRRRTRKDAPLVPLAALGPDGDAPCQPVSESGLDQSRQMQAALACLAELPAAQRELLAMRDLEGLSNDEVAAAMELSVAAVKSRVHRARLSLRHAVNLRLRLPPGGRR